jgi:hypothetical protein
MRELLLMIALIGAEAEPDPGRVRRAGRDGRQDCPAERVLGNQRV